MESDVGIRSVEEITLKTAVLSLEFPDPGVLHFSGINQLSNPFQQGLVLLVKLVVQNLVLLQNKGIKYWQPKSNDARIKIPPCLGASKLFKG